ncbi:hypothetical protein N7G274_006199 [Stereocaulon virgatum]|uniref:diphosphoinositol-polyphosphate diphosphatase n=1 Tax=Stereocaulon virgatum TaxID=373712 RepID=A0ABR4A931_9LECA
MDLENQQKIISCHGHLIASRPSTQIKVKGDMTVDDSGPPSPNNGGPVKNFGEVAPRFYRSSFPYAGNLDHLKSLGLKTILTLVNDKNESPEFTKFVNDNGINNIRIEVPAHKSPEVVIPIDIITRVLKIMLDKSNYPLLVHCNKGKHRTGCMVACYRKLHGWSNAAIITEYRRYAVEKFRPLDEAFISSFNAPVANQILKGDKVQYFPLDVKPILPTPPPSEKEIEDE